METYFSYSNILAVSSFVLLTISIFLMLRIYKSMNGKLYGLIWWLSFILLAGFSISDLYMVYFLVSDKLAEHKVAMGIAMCCSGLFTLVVVYAGYRTTIDLKVSNISKHYLNQIMQSMSSYLVVTDSNYKIKKANKAICQQLGIGQKKLIDKHIKSVFLRSDLTKVVENYSEQWETFIEDKSGELKSVLLSGEPIYKANGAVHGYVFQAFDNHQKEIQYLNSFFRSILNNSEFAIVATDTLGIITGMNPAAEKYFEYSEKDILGQVSPSIFHCKNCLEGFVEEKGIESPELGFSLFTDLIDEGEPVSREMQMVRRDGSSFYGWVTVNAIKNEGETIGYFEIIADISEKKNAEEELRKANADLKDFAHIVSHDLKAPLRAIGTLASWLHTDYASSLDEEGCEQLNLLRGRVTRMEGLINGILEYSRVGRVTQEQNTEDMNVIIEDVYDAVVPRERFKFIMDEPLPKVKIDRTRAHQIFQNIISNSVKYMDKEQGEIRIACEAKDNFWKFSVADNGPGIEDQYFDKIFQIFQTLKPRDEYESTGVGLAIVKKSVELYGGEVWLESELDKGTTFFFTLPQN